MGYRVILPTIHGQKYIPKYDIWRNSEIVESKLLGWQTALAHARKWRTNLFDNKPQKVQIVNRWTGEIVTLEEAEKLAAKIASMRKADAVISSTT